MNGFQGINTDYPQSFAKATAGQLKECRRPAFNLGVTLGQCKQADHSLSNPPWEMLIQGHDPRGPLLLPERAGSMSRGVGRPTLASMLWPRGPGALSKSANFPESPPSLASTLVLVPTELPLDKVTLWPFVLFSTQQRAVVSTQSPI